MYIREKNCEKILSGLFLNFFFSKIDFLNVFERQSLMVKDDKISLEINTEIYLRKHLQILHKRFSANKLQSFMRTCKLKILQIH